MAEPASAMAIRARKMFLVMSSSQLRGGDRRAVGVAAAAVAGSDAAPVRGGGGRADEDLIPAGGGRGGHSARALVPLEGRARIVAADREAAATAAGLLDRSPGDVYRIADGGRGAGVVLRG